MRIIMIEQGSNEWKKLRKNKIGASDASIILGINPWKTSYGLWQEKLGLIAEKEPTESMKEGLRLESEARKLANSMTDLHFVPMVSVHSERDWQLASFDGIDINGMAVEIKCGGKKLYDQAESGIIPEYYYTQMQHQLSVLESTRMFYFVYFEGKGKIIEVSRNDDFIKDMLERELEFWRCLQNLECPDLCDKDFINRSDEIWSKAASDWRKSKDILKESERQEKECRQRLIELAGQTNIKGAGVKISSGIRKGNIDYSKIKELESVDLEKYRKQSSPVLYIREYE